MKEFDIETIGRKMPYKAPSPEFFESFTTQTIERAKLQSRTKKMRIRAIITSVAAAAIIAIIALGEFSTHRDVNQQSLNYDNQLNEFISDLSTDEILLLLNEREAESEFLTNL